MPCRKLLQLILGLMESEVMLSCRHYQDPAVVEMGNKQIVNGELTPIGDISDFEDIANAAWYLGSDQSKNVTGTEVTVDGGMTCQLYPQI